MKLRVLSKINIKENVVLKIKFILKNDLKINEKI
jgi:hypothetical protein